MSDDLAAAVLATAVALNVLRAGSGSAAVIGTTDQAQAALAALDQDPTAHALERLLVEIRRCHDTGLTGSYRLEVARQVVSTAVRIDPRCQDLLTDLS